MVLSGGLLVQAVDEVDLRADADDRPRRRLLHRPDDEVRRTDLVGQLAHVRCALRVDHDDPLRMRGAEGGHVLRAEPLVDRAVALPEQEGGALEVRLGQAAHVQPGVPDPHVVVGVAHGQAGVAAEVLVREEQDLLATGSAVGPRPKRPLQDGAGVGRRADRTAVAADEGLEGGRGVHVRDGDDGRDVDGVLQHLPRLLDGVDVGQVGHRAPGVEVRQDDLLVVARQHVGRLGHEVDAAEDDVVGLRALLGEDRQAERVAPGVGPAHDLVALVVVAEHVDPVAERGLGGADALGQLLGRGRGVRLGQGGLQAQHRRSAYGAGPSASP